MDVQPLREGTIVEWLVAVGQSVQQGQPLAKLSAPTRGPEAVTTLAEKAEALATATGELEAAVAFADRRGNQLRQLRTRLEEAGGQTLVAETAATAALRADVLRDRAEGAARSIHALVSARQGFDPVTAYRQNPGGFSVTFKPGVGDGNPQFRAEFTRDLGQLVRAIDGQGDLAVASRQFLRTADGLVASSVANEEDPEAVDLAELRATISEERDSVLEATNDANDARVEAAAAKREGGSAGLELAEKLAEVDDQLLEIDRDVAVARVAVRASQTAFTAVNEVLGTQGAVVAPRSGVVSIIRQNAGDFVEPGDAVAAISSGQQPQVRFQIPGNALLPKVGDELVVSRPGYGTDQRKIRITGVGGALDERGAYTAEATFTERVDWPAHASLRVAPPTGQATPPLVSLPAIWFDAQGKPTVWTVDAEDRIQAANVKTGKTVGDKVELIEGVAAGTRIVSSATTELRAGMKLPRGPLPAESTNEPASDGHDHEH